MARAVGTFFTVVVTALVTAALTSAVWLLLFNLMDDKPRAARPPATPSVELVAPAAPTDTAGDMAGDTDYATLAARRLTVPVAGIAVAALVDTYGDDRGGGERRHQALDIAAPRGTPVVAVEDGRIEKLFESVQGGLTIYQFDPSRRYAYYYAHLDRYADNLVEGAPIRRGEVIGYVGSTGNAPVDAPHLHFAILKLGPEKNWSEGTPINPYPILTVTGSTPLASIR